MVSEGQPKLGRAAVVLEACRLADSGRFRGCWAIGAVVRRRYGLLVAYRLLRARSIRRKLNVRCRVARRGRPLAVAALR